MARIRTLKPEFWTDEKVVELSPFARLLFIGLWNFADDDGRMVHSPKRIKMQILPADDADISELLGEIRRQSLIETYVVDGVEILQVCKFTKHQKVDKRTPSKLPENPDSPRIPPSSPDGRDQGRDQGREGKEMTLDDWLWRCEVDGETPIPPDDPIFDWSKEIQLPREFLLIAWFEFKSRFRSGGTDESKRYSDWRRAWRNYVRKGWLKVWYAKPDGAYELTTLGLQAKRLMEAA